MLKEGLIDEDEIPAVQELNSHLETLSIAETRSWYGGQDYEPEGFKRLIVYQRGMDLVIESYRLTQILPSSERFGLMSQIRRAALSITLNIAEGWGLNSRAQFARMVDIARGSTHELDAAFEVMKRLDYATEEQCAEAARLTNIVSSMLKKLAHSLRTPKKPT